MKGSPCHHCTERHTACHSNCKAYKSWKAEHDENMSKARMAKEASYVALNRFWRIKLLYDHTKG